jgi:hypothetical protein
MADSTAQKNNVNKFLPEYESQSVFRSDGADYAYTLVSNRLLQDSGIDWETRGMIADLLSRPKDWDISVMGLVAMANGLTKKAKIYRMINAAMASGYIRRFTKRGADGRVAGYTYVVSDNPSRLALLSDFQETAKQEAEKQPQQSKDLKKVKTEKKYTAPTSHFPHFEEDMETKTPPIPQGGSGHSCVMTVRENAEPTSQPSQPTWEDEEGFVNHIKIDDSATHSTSMVSSLEETPEAVKAETLVLTPPEPEAPSVTRKKAKKAPSTKLDHNTDPEFGKFWDKYPNKKGKAGSYAHWKRFCKDKPELASLLPQAAMEYESDLRRQYKSASEAKQRTCCGYNWFNKGLHEYYVDVIIERSKPQPVENSESQLEQRAREERERVARVAEACSETKRARFVEFLSKVYSNVKDAWNEKVIEYFHARKYWDIDALIPVDVKNEARAAIGAPLLAC